MDWINNIFSLSNFWGFAIAGIFSLFLWYTQPTAQFPASILAVFVFICCLSIWINGLLWRMMKNVKPHVIQAVKPIRFNRSGRGENQSLVLLLEPNDLLPINSFVTIYSVEDSLDEYLATAKVSHIQGDKLIQTQVIHIGDGIDFEPLLKNNAADIRKLIIRPIITDNVFKILESSSTEQ